MSAQELSADEKAAVARMGIHREPTRIVVACINWPHPDAPHAMSYLLRDGVVVGEQFHPTWSDAMDRANRLARRLSKAGAAL